MTASRPDRQCSIRRSRRIPWNGAATPNVLSADARGMGKVRAPAALGCARRLARDAGCERRPPRPGRRSRQPRHVPTTESGRASQLLSTELPGPPERRPERRSPSCSAATRWRSPTRRIGRPSPTRSYRCAEMRVSRRSVPITTPTPSLLSRDGHAMLAFVQLKDHRAVAEAYFEDLRALVRSDTLTDPRHRRAPDQP